MAKEGEKMMVTAVYKVHLHCPKCAEDIRKPLLRIPGVHNVDVKFEKGEVTVKGTIGEKEMHKRLEKLSKKKVEMLPNVGKEKMVKETKETVRTTTIKVYLHCNKCEDDLRRKLLKHKGIHNVKMDAKAQSVTIEGNVESEKLLTFMKKRMHKHAEVIPPKQEKKDERKEDIKGDKKQKEVEKKEKAIVEVEKKEKATMEVKSSSGTAEVVEFKEEKKVDAKTPEGKVPYFVHFVYAPQMFSDENPNACFIM